MTETFLHDFAIENNIAFENTLVGYVKEVILLSLGEKGYGRSLWLKNKSALSRKGYARRVNRSLTFVYKEDERVLKSDGFVPGCAYDADFLMNLFETEIKSIPEFQVKNPEVSETTLSFDLYYKEMYVPFSLEILPLKEENLTPNQEVITLPICGRALEVLTYPMEQEAAHHVVKLCKELELINEMEHYLEAYKLFAENSLEGVRLQNAIALELEKAKLSYDRDDLSRVLAFRDYGYMKKKWKVLLRRQKLESPAWEDVIDLLDKVLSPIWQAGKEDVIFFGDWMPEIGRYLD